MFRLTRHTFWGTVLAGALMAVAPVITAQTSTQWMPPVLINSSGAGDIAADESVQLATDKKGTWVAAWQTSAQQGQAVIAVATSPDNGQSWSNEKLLETSGTLAIGQQIKPSVAVDGLGNWAVAWETFGVSAETSGTESDIYIARSADGENWSKAVPLNSNWATDSGFDAGVSLAADEDGNWVAAWTSSSSIAGASGGSQHLVCALSDDGGATWSAPQIVRSNPVASAQTVPVHLSLSEAAGTWVLGSEVMLNGRYRVLVTRSKDAGKNWSDAVYLHAPNDGVEPNLWPSVSGDGRGNWLVAWQLDTILGSCISASRSQDDGQTWQTTLIHPAIPTAEDFLTFDVTPAVTTDGYGNWVATWASAGRGGGIEDFDIYYSRSTDYGETWSEPVSLDARLEEDTGHDLFPVIGSDGEGNWIAMWDSTDSLGDTIGNDTDILGSSAGFVPNVADLALTASGTQDIYAGELASYSFTIVNNGPTLGRKIVLTDRLPEGAEMISVTGGTEWRVTGDTLFITMGDLDAGTTVTGSFEVRYFKQGQARHSFALVSDSIDVVADNDRAEVITNVDVMTDITIDWSNSASQWYVGRDFPMTLSASNAGPSAATNVKASFELPAGVEFISVGNSASVARVSRGKVVMDFATILAEGTSSCTVVLRASIDGPVSLIGTAETASAESSTSNNTAQANRTVVPASDLEVQLVRIDRTYKGLQGLVGVLVKNLGPSEATNVVVQITLPPDVSGTWAYVFDGTYSGTGNRLTLQFPNLPVGVQGMAGVFFTPLKLGSQPIEARADSYEADLISSNDSATMQIQVEEPPNLTVTVTPSLPVIQVSDVVEYTARVTNTSNVPSSGCRIRFALPGNTDLLGGMATTGTITADAQWELGGLRPGEFAEIRGSFRAMEIGNAVVRAEIFDPAADANVADNVAEGSCQLVSSGADLIGDFYFAEQTCKRTNCKLNFQLLMTNIGTVAVPPTRVRLFLSRDAVLDPTDLAVWESAVSMKVSKSGAMSPELIKASTTLPSGIVATNNYLIAILDADNNVRENSERNNIVVFGPIP